VPSTGPFRAERPDLSPKYGRRNTPLPVYEYVDDVTFGVVPWISVIDQYFAFHMLWHGTPIWFEAFGHVCQRRVRS
jgi:hypothetical protein